MPRQAHELFDTREQKATLEARNGLLQFEAIEALVAGASLGFELSPAHLREFHRLAIQDIYTCAGDFRTGPVWLARNGVVSDDKHQPPPPEQVPVLVDEMCAYLNDNFGSASAIHLSSYAMWRLNWIHPFFGGNGRCSRALSYLLMNLKMGFNLPGINTIAQQIERNRDPYYEALGDADEAWKRSSLDLSKMEKLLSGLLAAQLLSVHEKATMASGSS
jgi:Fic family protein